jgi:hypothetical protein
LNWEKIGEIVPFLEDVLSHDPLTAWRRVFEKLGGFFNRRFGKDWQKKDEQFWKDFTEKLKTDGSSYVETPTQKLGFY